MIGLGGGACLDVAKAIALGAVNDVDVRELDYRTEHLAPGLPVLAIPTTAGTGSETNGFGVFADGETGRKIYLGNATVQPFAALLDPELTVGLPAAATAAAGMDALSHALESLCARHGNPYSEALAHGVARTVARVPAAGGRATAATSRRAASCCSRRTSPGHAQQTTGLGLAHGIAHALSSRIGLPHGLACASRCRRCWPSAGACARSGSRGSPRRSGAAGADGRDRRGAWRCRPRSARPCRWPIAASRRPSPRWSRATRSTTS